MVLPNPLPSRYRIIEEVGQGGMAVVYRAQDETLRREVAVKVLHPHLLAEAESRARLQREARAVAKLNHDGILQIFDYSGDDAQSSFIVTEFIDGQTLKQFLAHRKLPVPELAALIVLEVGSALAHAHSAGIIHRDVKPENVMVRKDGAIKLMDFGVAQVVDLERMTVTGQILGSPAYMAPEVLDGKTLDFRSDIFSVGVMLYQMATGALPFSGKNPHEVLKRIAEGRFADPRTVSPRVSDHLAKVIARSLARDPNDRYPRLSLMLDDLRVYVADAGLQEVREELTGYLTGPEAYEKGLDHRLATALVASGQREQAAGRTARSLELWNRALALEPENPTVLAELRRLERGERLRRRVTVAIAVAVLAGMASGTLAIWRRAVRENQVGNGERPAASLQLPKAPSPVTAAGIRALAPVAKAAAHSSNNPVPSIHAPREARRVALAAERVDPREEAARESSHSAAASTPKQVELTLGPHPPKVEVWMDGQKRFDFGPRQNRIVIPWDGPHTLEFRNDTCCNRKEVTVGPQAYRPPGDHLYVNLEPKPARLTVNLQPARADASILLREVSDVRPNPWRTSVRPGERVPVPFDVGDEMRKSLDVVVVLGDKTVTERVNITAGESRQVTVRLDE
ncbi:MAG: serine/threonine-protein kinase [Polyangia bacterium]